METAVFSSCSSIRHIIIFVEEIFGLILMIVFEEYHLKQRFQNEQGRPNAKVQLSNLEIFKSVKSGFKQRDRLNGWQDLN